MNFTAQGLMNDVQALDKIWQLCYLILSVKYICE